MSRRRVHLLTISLLAILHSFAAGGQLRAQHRVEVSVPPEPIDIGSRLELFIDGALIDQLDGDIELRLNRPVPREAVLELERPWEDSIIFMTVLEDDGVIRLYYSARSHRLRYREVACVAESRDGIHFIRPDTGLHDGEFGGPDTNIVWNRGPTAHHFTPFIDENPATPEAMRYKGIARHPSDGGGGFGAFYSPDGISWEVAERGIYTSHPSDTQNIAFWDAERELYVAYARAFIETDGRRIRSIRRGESTDYFEGWEDTGPVQFTDDRVEQMYTNGIHPYLRAPHIYIGLAGRFLTSRHKLEGHAQRGIGEGALISSRDGKLFHRWEEAFIRPGTDAESWGDRNIYPAFGMIQTSPEEISVYWNEHYRYDTARVRRGTIRTDGFVSVSARADEGEMLTVPFVFSGDRLIVNYETSASGSIDFELTDENGEVIPGYTGGVLYGDEIEQVVLWNGNGDVGELAGKPVRLRVRMKDADFYSFRFTTAEAIRETLQEVHTEAVEILSRNTEGFLLNGLERLGQKFQLLDNRIKRDTDITQEAIQTATMVERQIAGYREIEAIAFQAETELNRADSVLNSPAGFGRIYMIPVRLLAGIVGSGLNDPTLTPAQLSSYTERLSGAISDWERLQDLRPEAVAFVAEVEPMLLPDPQGFTAAYQNRLAAKLDVVSRLLAEPDATLEAFTVALSELGAAVEAFEKLPMGQFPLKPVRVPHLPFVYEVRSAAQWQSGLLDGVESTPEGLALKDERAVKLLGSDSFVVAEASDALKPDVITIEAWIKLPEQALYWSPAVHLGNDRIRQSADYGHAYMIWFSRNRPEFTIGGKDGFLVRVNGDQLETGRWYHIAGQYDGSEAKLYVDGELIKAKPYDGGMDYTFSDVLQVGGQFWSDKYDWFRGQIKDLRVWSVVRSAEDIRNSRDDSLVGDEDGLVGAWFSGRLRGEGAVAYDRSPQANHATMENAHWVFEDGYWLSNPIQLPASALTSARLDWDARVQGNPGQAAAQLEVGYSSRPDQIPDHWHRCVSGRLLTPPEAAEKADGWMWIRASLSRNDSSSFPILNTIQLKLE